MGIARALRRVKRQAKRGGLGALRSGLGEELRSGAIPAPLRGAARKIAAILDPRASRHSSHKPGSTATPVVERSHNENLRAAPPEHANKVGSDRGDPPNVEPEVPASGTAVDPIAVGATPVYDATPIDATPIDTTPIDAAPIDATPREVAITELAPVAVEVPAPAAVESPRAAPVSTKAEAPKAKASKSTGGDGNAKKSAPPPPASAKKEKLAPAKEAAKSPAPSGPKGASKRPKGPSGKASKKKK